MLSTLDGRRLYYDLIGPEDAPVVLFSHSLASDSGMWAEQMPPLLTAGFRILRVDMRGHGGSDPASGDTTMSALAGDLARLLDDLDIARVHYIGLSIGGMIGQAFALEHRDRLLSAFWCDTLPAGPKGGEAAWAERVRVVTAAKSVAPLADQTMERWFSAGFRPRRPTRWKEIRDTVAATTAEGYLGCTAAILGFDFASRLPSLRLPVLVVCGAEDPGTPPAENRRLAGLVPGARYEEIAGARHFVNVEKEWAFNRIMMEWLEAQRSAR